MFRQPFLAVVLLSFLAQTPATRTQDAGPQQKLALLKRTERKPGPKADELEKLLVARYNAAHIVLRRRTLEVGERRDLHEEVILLAAARFVDAELELLNKREERLALLEQHVEFLKEAERVVVAQFEAGGARGTKEADVGRVRHDRLSAEIRLLRAKQEKTDKPR